MKEREECKYARNKNEWWGRGITSRWRLPAETKRSKRRTTKEEIERKRQRQKRNRRSYINNRACFWGRIHIRKRACVRFRVCVCVYPNMLHDFLFRGGKGGTSRQDIQLFIILGLPVIALWTYQYHDRRRHHHLPHERYHHPRPNHHSNISYEWPNRYHHHRGYNLHWGDS